MNYMVFSTTRETRAHGAGVVEVEKFYGTTDQPNSNPDSYEWRTATVKLPDNMMFGSQFDNAPVVVNKATGNITWVALPASNETGFYRPLKSEPGVDE